MAVLTQAQADAMVANGIPIPPGTTVLPTPPGLAGSPGTPVGPTSVIPAAPASAPTPPPNRGGPLRSPLRLTPEQIERDFKDGLIPPERAIAALESLGIAQAAAVLRHWEGGGTGTIVGPGQGRVAQVFERPDIQNRIDREGTGRTETFPRAISGTVPEPTTENLPERFDLFEDETRPDLERRAVAGAFGTGLVPIGRRAAGRAFERFERLDPLINFGTGDLGSSEVERFANFASNRPSQSQLQGIRTQIGQGGADDLGFQSFTEGLGPQGVFSASLQPGLAGIGDPNIRRRLSGILQRDFATRRAQTPEMFQTQQQLLDLFNEFQGFGR